MNNLSRNELIKALVKGLKLDDNIFNYQAVAEEIEQIQEHQFMDFYKTVTGADTYGNGLKAIIKTVEQFKPVTQDLTEIKAKELIELVIAINDKVFQDAQRDKRTFEDQLEGTIFRGISEKDLAILSNVKPHMDLKTLISKINHYNNGLEQLEAFKQAIEYSKSYSGMVECSKVKKALVSHRDI